jgi:hypothetical protein
MKTLLTAISSVILTVGALPAEASNEYDFLQIHGVVKSEYSDIDQFGLTGFELRASKRLDDVFAELRYRDLDDTDNGLTLEENRWSASVGYIVPYSASLHFDIRANYGNIEAELSNSFESVGIDVDYYGASGFIHYEIIEPLTVYAGLEYQNLKDAPDQKAYHLGTTYSFNALSLGAEYVKYSDSDALSLFLRYSF